MITMTTYPTKSIQEWGIFIADFLQGPISTNGNNENNSNVIFNLEDDYIVFEGLRFDRSSEDYFNELNQEEVDFVLVAKINNSVFYSKGLKDIIIYNIFNNRMKNIIETIASTFVVESFEDWLNDMENTDWDYYGTDPISWVLSLMRMTNSEILAELKKYAKDNESEAYEKGFLPDNEGVDVREWSSTLYDYFIKE